MVLVNEVILIIHVASRKFEYASLDKIVTQEVVPMVIILKPEPRTCPSRKSHIHSNVSTCDQITDDFVAQTDAGETVMSTARDQNTRLISEKLNPNFMLMPPETVTTALNSATSPAKIEDPETPNALHLK